MKLNVDTWHLLAIWQRCDDSVAHRIGNAEALMALKRNYLEFILMANFPLSITCRNFAKKPAINVMYLPA